jgi:hypothetical protein
LANDLAGALEKLPAIEKAYRQCRSSYRADARNE